MDTDFHPQPLKSPESNEDMGAKQNTDVNPQTQKSPTINQSVEEKGNTDVRPQPQNSPDVIDEEEEFVVTPVQEKDGESPPRIPQMEAICEICCTLLQEGATVMKTECGCDQFSLIHKGCLPKNPEKVENAKCGVCEQVIKYVKVNLSRPKEETAKAETTVLSSSSSKSSTWFQKLLSGKPPSLGDKE